MIAATKSGGDEDAFTRDLAMAQAEMENAAYNRINPHFRSQYADFASVRAATLPALNKYGFAMMQTIHASYDDAGKERMCLRTTLMHKSGDSRSSEYPIPIGGTPQQIGSAITYARRYSWSAMCGIASEEDDDGNDASNSTAHVEPKTKAAARADKDYETLIDEMRACETRNELYRWRQSIMSRRAALPDSWRETLDEECELHRLNLIEVEKVEAEALAEPVK